MPLDRKDNIGDTTTSTGTGTINLEAVAQTGAQIFAGHVTSGSTVRYDIRNADESEWEIGEGVFTDGSPDTLTRVTVYASSNSGSLVNFSAGTKNVSMVITAKDVIGEIAPQNLLKNGNFINNSTNGYGSTPDDWTSSNANPVQGGIPALTKQNLIDGLGIADGDIEGLWPLNEASGNALDLSSNAYNLTDTNTVSASSDGLMASARDFELANTEYFSIADASCPNLEISGSQTFFAFVKPESISSFIAVIGKASGANAHVLQITDTGKAQIQFTGLTTNFYVNSDVTLVADKWYFLCGVYDSVNTKLKIWVNGIKKEVTASGSSSDTNGIFTIGNALATINTPYDGLIQNACVLSVALTDNQVKKLFAMTMYKGQKIRRATTDAYLYEELTQPQVEQLRGETIAFSADAYCESTNHGIYITTDGTGGTTTKAHPASANAWERIGLSVTVPADATYIRYGLLAETTDGNSWFRECSGYIGSTILPYAHSADDWSRFPRLLKMDIPKIISGYQFEQFKVHPYTPTGIAASNVTMTGRFIIYDKAIWSRIVAAFTGAITYTSLPTLPAVAGANIQYISGSNASNTSGTGSYFDNGTANAPIGLVPIVIANATTLTALVKSSDGANFSATVPITWANGDGFSADFTYEID